MNQLQQSIVDSIPSSQSDDLLRQWGYDLTGEYVEVLLKAGLEKPRTILELATGTGRMSAVLTRLGHKIITGDITQDRRSDVEKRITQIYLSQVAFIKLDMERLPFADNSVDSIVCMNTLHELEHPRQCLQEIIRVHSRKGPLIVGDFNDLGFDMMLRLHRVVYGNDHSTGSLTMTEAKPMLQQFFPHLSERRTLLNVSFIA